jgi:hypothetical protein
MRYGLDYTKDKILNKVHLHFYKINRILNENKDYFNDLNYIISSD